MLSGKHLKPLKKLIPVPDGNNLRGFKMVFRLVLPSDELERVQLGLSIPVEIFNSKAMITNLFQNSCSCHPLGGMNLEELRCHCKLSLHIVFCNAGNFGKKSRSLFNVANCDLFN